MEATKIPSVRLGSNPAAKEMPLLALGTAAVPFGGPATRQAVLDAIELGYRHIDTAAIYLSEDSIGQAVVDAIDRGLIRSREELFITSKLWCCDASPELVLPALSRTLQNLRMERIDLYLIHWPLRVVAGKYELPIDASELLPFDLPAVWQAMEECQRLGLTGSIGVSNFSCKKLDELLRVATIPPVVNQVEMNIHWQQRELREYCKGKGIHICAYSPLGGQNYTFGSKNSLSVLDNEAVKRIAQANGKTVAQICLRWAYEQGGCVIAKSYTKERIKENMRIFDWSLTEEEKHVIDHLPQQNKLYIDGLIVGNVTPMVIEKFAHDVM